MNTETGLTVAQFCKLAGMDRREWELIKAQGRGPTTTRVNGRVMIASEAMNDWLKNNAAFRPSATSTPPQFSRRQETP
jgi:hypothetical protein